MNEHIVFDLDPQLVDLGFIQLRYYGTIFSLMFWIAFFVWRHYLLRSGRTTELAVRFLPWFLGGLLIGARLGHCLFYEPDFFLAHPTQMLYFWKGGLSSHGATVGLLAGLLAFGKIHKLGFLDTVDRFSPSAAVGAAMVRLGNFFNSEIVGRQTDLPWAIKFVRHDCKELGLCGVFEKAGHESTARFAELVERTPARHPTQLYEFLLGVAVFVLLVVVDRRAGMEQRPTGLITGMFAVVYFGGRFFLEFTKDYQGIDDGWSLTMGQWLCIPFFLIGLGLLQYARNREQRD
jgi:phosphatidylglycerol---prolipoprotein diacylglyceryl transferase